MSLKVLCPELYLSLLTINECAADSGVAPYVNIELYGGQEKGSVRLYNLPGNDSEPAKGDLWIFNIDDFGFRSTCVTKSSIARLRMIMALGLQTSSLRSGSESELLTADFNTNTYLDGNAPEYDIGLTIV